MARGDLRLARLFYQIEAESSGLKRELDSAEASLGRLTGFIKTHPIAAMGALAAAATAAGLKAAEMATQFDGAVRRIAAVVPGATSQLGQLRAETDRLAASRGLSSEQVLGGLSAVAREGVADLDALVARFQILQTVADASGSDLGALATGFDQVLDVLGLTDASLAQVAARLAQVSQGRFPLEDLFAAFQAAAPAIRANNLSFDEAANALANFVANGLNAKQAGSQLKDTLEKLGREGLAGLPNLIGEVDVALAGLAERATAVEQGADRMSTALRERFLARLRDIGQGINQHLLDPLRAGLLLATEGGGGLTDRLLRFGAGLGGARPPLAAPAPPAPDRGGPVLLPELTVSAPSKEQLKDLRETVTRTFTANLPTTVDATAAAIGQLGQRLTALGVPAGEVSARLAPLLEQLERLGTAAADVRLTQAIGDAEGAASAAASLETLGQLAADLTQQIQGANEGSAEQLALHERLLQVNEAIARVNGRIADLKEDEAQGAQDLVQYTEDAAARAQALEAALSLTARQIADVARGAIGLAQAFGLADNAAAALLQNVVSIAGALPGTIKAFANLGKLDAAGNPLSTLSGALTGGIAVIGGLAGLVSGLFGESADSRRDREIREQNTRAIRELTKSFEDQVAGKTVSAANAGVEALLGAGTAGLGKGRFNGALDLEAVTRALAPLGLSLQNLKDLLKQINPDLKLNTSSTEDFLDSLKQMRKALAEVDFRAFADSFAGRLAFLQARFDLLDLSNPIDQLAELQRLGASESPVLQSLLGGLDLTTAGGRQQAEEALVSLLDQLKNGTLTGADLGGLSSAELLDLIRQIEGLIDAVNADQGTGGAPRQETFGATRGLTEVTGSRLAGLLVSQDTHLVEIRDLLAAFVPVVAPALPPGVGVGPGPVVFEVNVHGSPDAATAQAIGATVGAAAVDSYRQQGSRIRARKTLYGDTVVR